MQRTLKRMMMVRAPLTKIAALYLSKEVVLLQLPNPFAFRQHEVIFLLTTLVKTCINSWHKSNSTVLNSYICRRFSRFYRSLNINYSLKLLCHRKYQYLFWRKNQGKITCLQACPFTNLYQSFHICKMHVSMCPLY